MKDMYADIDSTNTSFTPMNDFIAISDRGVLDGSIASLKFGSYKQI
jgi:hypothetical protein